MPIYCLFTLCRGGFWSNYLVCIYRVLTTTLLSIIMDDNQTLVRLILIEVFDLPWDDHHLS